MPKQKRSKIKLTTNRGKLFDYFLNIWLNFLLYSASVDDNPDLASEIVANELQRLKLVK